jgi:CRISPR-associated protein Csd1
MGLDSATPGRLAMTYYREIKGSEFLSRVETWHASTAWFQNFGKDRHFVGAPAPRDIAEAAFGQRIDAKHRKAVVERLLPCVVDGLPVPTDLVHSAVRRASNRVGLDRWEFEKCLGVACALYRKLHSEWEYQMSLEPDRTTRDYLYGRLLAIADHLEERALWVAGEKRETAAARLMQRFSDRPFSTWRTIELSLVPYRARLKANRGGFLHELDKTLDAVMGLFHVDDFQKDSSLSGEFLLGFHCQRRDLRPPDPGGALAEEAVTTEVPETTTTAKN